VNSYVIITIIVLLALAPLWHFMPSKRQRHTAQMREAAALAGLFVEFRDLPVSAARSARLSASERQVLYYGCRLPPGRSAVRSALIWNRVGADWVSVPPRIPAPDIAVECPDSVLALAQSDGSCGVYWREEGEVDEVQNLARLLQQWRSCLAES
jgi:hypothetical protein